MSKNIKKDFVFLGLWNDHLRLDSPFFTYSLDFDQDGLQNDTAVIPLHELYRIKKKKGPVGAKKLSAIVHVLCIVVVVLVAAAAVVAAATVAVATIVVEQDDSSFFLSLFSIKFSAVKTAVIFPR